MKYALLLIVCAHCARAEWIETTIEWRPSCDGATITVVSENDRIRSIRADARHSTVLREWTVHYIDGSPATAEYRERKRGKILEGDRAGEDSGENPLVKLQTFRATEGAFHIADKELADDLADLLEKAKPPKRGQTKP